MFLNVSLGAEILPHLPPTLDDARMGIGDMFSSAVQSHVAFRIWVIQEAGRSPEAAAVPDRTSLKRFTTELNKRLSYLSDGQFQLRLRHIQFVSVSSDGSLAQLENRIIAQTGGRGFAMIIGAHYDGGAYLGRGVFKISSDEVASKPFNRKALHEILHGLISPAHSTSHSSTLEQYNPVIGLDPQEARFLGWPDRPAVSPDSPLFD